LQAHVAHTDSSVAAAILDEWPVSAEQFKRVMPLDYQRVLQVMSDAEAEGLDEEATLAKVMEVARG
jgi:glutamate synthase (NADPH) large chain